MNRHIQEGSWKQFKGGVKETWGELRADGRDQIDGRRERLAGRHQ